MSVSSFFFVDIGQRNGEVMVSKSKYAGASSGLERSTLRSRFTIILYALMLMDIGSCARVD